jgi:hypothetical protein
MNDETIDPSESSQTSNEADSSTERQTSDPFQNFSRSLRDALQNGGNDARRMFDEEFPKAKEEFAKGVHDVAYAVAYAAAFGGALLREITPEPLKNGVREGTASGQRAAEEVLRQRREKAEREANTSLFDDEPFVV